MEQTPVGEHPFRINALRRGRGAPVAPIVERLLGFESLRRRYADVAGAESAEVCLHRIARRLRLEVEADPAAADRVPGVGPVLAVANHPFGGVEGISLARLLLTVRLDVKVLANHLLTRVPELRGLFIPVDPFAAGRAGYLNQRGLREAVRWLREGGLLLAFPAGEVSHLRLGERRVCDPPWAPAVGGLARIAGAAALPLYCHGANGLLFHLAGLLHPGFRTALLPREFLGKEGHRLRVRIGETVSARRLAELPDDAARARYLRLRTPALAAGPARPQRIFAGWKDAAAPSSRSAQIAEPEPPDRLAGAVATLSPDRVLVAGADHVVLRVAGAESPPLLREIGRLREATFRAAGEGTGRSVDLDRFDLAYDHLVLWHRGRREIVGAYRAAVAARVLAREGPRGLYTSTLFRYRPAAFGLLAGGIELGRSFVRPEQQRSYAPLMLLWKGIGRLLLDTGCRCLFGAVSVSDAYLPASQALIAHYLERRCARSDAGRLAVSRRPPRFRGPAAVEALRGADLLADLDEVGALVSEMEPDRKSVPILVRQYLRLGGKVVALNRDPAFGNVLDALVVVDLADAEPRLLGRYLGAEEAAELHARLCGTAEHSRVA